MTKLILFSNCNKLCKKMCIYLKVTFSVSGKLEDVTKRVNGIEISVEENKEAIDDLEDSSKNS